jgi:hypothetical protein
MISIGCEHKWGKYVRSVMGNQLQCLDLVVRMVSVDPAPYGFHQNWVRRHPLTIHYQTLTWMWNACGAHLYLSPMKSKFLGQFEMNVGLMMSW